MQETGPFLLSATGIAIGIFFFVRARAAQVKSTDALGLVQKLEGQLDEARAQREKDAKKISNHAGELAELRKRLEKAKRKSVKQNASGGTAVAASALADLEKTLEQSRRERDEAREESLGLSQELSRLRKSSAQPSAPVEKTQLEGAVIEKLEARVEAAEALAGKARAESIDHAKTVARLKRKLSTQELLYVSMRSELDAKKDRLRTQQEEVERLRALRVAMLDPEDSDTRAASESASVDPNA